MENLAKDITAQPKFSKPGKMPCRSWSLQALETCPGSIGPDGELVPACKGCYATQGNYGFAPVKALRAHNWQDWRADDWVEAMSADIGLNDLYFRWFDSGDMATLPMAEKIYQVMANTPDTKHWLPTRMHKFAKFADVLAKMEALPNVIVRKSSDSVTGEAIDGATTSTIFTTEEQLPAGAVVCRAYENKGKCGTCRACWSDAEVIAYPAHGAKMIKLAKAAAA